MVTNFPGPYDIRIKYDVDGLNHLQKINCDVDGDPIPGTDASLINILRRDLSMDTMPVVIDEYVALMTALYPVGATIQSAELWKYVPESFDAQFISVYPIAEPGLSGSPYTPAHQLTFTARTLEGGIMRLVYMETVNATNAVTAYPTGSVPIDAIMAYANAADTWMLGRDTSPPIAALNRSGGQNEAIWRKRFRA